MGDVTKIELPARGPSQATQIEQSRAIAEVQAAVVVAQQIPRVVPVSVGEMEESCKQLELAEQAFFSFPRGKKVVKGSTVHLARELARCWGNVQYGIAELSRDGERSEMMAWAWDVQTNTRASQTFIVPHKRDVDGKVVPILSMRDVYENNANQGARRVREAIFNVLPPWFTSKAEDICRATLESGGGKPLAQRVADAVRSFDGVGVALADLERSVGRKQSDWTAHDVTQLGVKFKTIDRGEASVEELFPRETQQAVSVAEIQAQQAPKSSETGDGSGGPVDAAGSPPSDTTPPTTPDPEPQVEVEVAQPVTDETKKAAKAAKAKLRTTVGQERLGELFDAEDISQLERTWTEAQAIRIIEIAGEHPS